jgi:hypothetical protein
MAGGGFIPPYNLWRAITPSDTVNLSDGQCDAFYVGGAGDVVAVNPGGNPVTFSATVAGAIYPVTVIRINATSTTATNLVALYNV